MENWKRGVVGAGLGEDFAEGRVFEAADDGAFGVGGCDDVAVAVVVVEEGRRGRRPSQDAADATRGFASSALPVVFVLDPYSVGLHVAHLEQSVFLVPCISASAVVCQVAAYSQSGLRPQPNTNSLTEAQRH